MHKGQKVTLRLDVVGRLKIVGWAFPGPLSIIHQTDHGLLLKAQGGSDWAGVGSRAYYGTEYLLFRKLGSKSDFEWSLEFVREEEPGRFWRGVRAVMIAECELLGEVTGGTG